MKALLDSSKALLAAFAISVGLGGAAAAQDNVANVEQPTQASIQVQEFASLDGAQALNQSTGRIVLHFGEGFSAFRIEQMITQLEDRGLEVLAFSGGANDGVEAYFYGNHIPKVFASDESQELIYVVTEIAKRNNLIASNDIETVSNG